MLSDGRSNRTMSGCQSNNIFYEYYIWNPYEEERIIPWYGCLNGFHSLDGTCEANLSGGYHRTDDLWYGARVSPCLYASGVNPPQLPPTPSNIRESDCHLGSTRCGPAGLSWYTCTDGWYVYMGQVAPGTVCINNAIQPR